jgi:hypothetical protein
MTSPVHRLQELGQSVWYAEPILGFDPEVLAAHMPHDGRPD